MQLNMNLHFTFFLIIEVFVFPTCIDGFISRHPYAHLPGHQQREEDTYSNPYRPKQSFPRTEASQPLNKAAETNTGQCVQCCDRVDPSTRRKLRYHYYNDDPPEFQAIPQINLSILKGEKGEKGPRGFYGKHGKVGAPGPPGPSGLKGEKGNTGKFGDPCKLYYAAFSVGRKKELHSNNYYQILVFDTVYVNLYDQFNMFTGKFYCTIPGIYHFNLNVHTWNQKETYMHIMKNDEEVVILYAQPSDRSIMQSQSIMMDLEQNDEVWIRLFKGERENAIFSDGFDTYITFNGYLIKPNSEN
ncbi:complement C1q tumor necrosis factor-related protein 1-like [Pristis pectinata]|uniref:complement C1q tumor necrosis factor-related protein 1-like n=1 Tax=Pristis pectinata TaxID=685728 RepID=UPI00223D3369|nr:complement C1q tumor necrosis factor-related protein 1-like [Pristis pectinata]